MRRNYWVALSFANLVYLRAWADLLPASPSEAFLRKTLPGFSLYFAIAGDVLLLSVLVFAVISVASRLPRWVQAVLPIAALAMVALAIRSVASVGILRSGAVSAGVLAVVAALTPWFSSQIGRLLRGAALAATPCLAVTFVGSLFYLYGRPPLPPDPALASRLAGSPPVRILWILFDDWDQRLTFPDRTLGTSLPVIDHLAETSFSAQQAVAVQGNMPVGAMSTFGAIPALLYGKPAVRTGIADEEAQISFSADGSEPFGSGENIFSRVRAHGWNAAAAGWYMPYCRAFASQLTDCYWDQRYLQAYSASTAFPQAAVDETRMLFETSAFSPFGAALVSERHFSEYQSILAAARRYAADPSIGLALIHFNIPHAPYFYDPKLGRSLRYGDIGDLNLYNDALRRVDQTLGEVLGSLSKSGLGSKTAIILSADHPFRFSPRPDPHVPFIVHLPSGTTGLEFNEEFSAIRTADLAMAIANAEVRSPADVADYLRKNRWR